MTASNAIDPTTVTGMSRGSVASLVAAAAVSLALFASAPALALSSGYGKGRSYCAYYGNTASRYSFDGVYACATTSSVGPTTFDSAGLHPVMAAPVQR